MVASGSICRALSAASATAGAVLRPAGSSRIADAFIPKARICSATVNRCASLHPTRGGWAPAIPARRVTVSCNMVCLPVSASNCLGYISRDSGQSLVPAPPDKITGINRVTIHSLGFFATTDCLIAEAGARHLRRVVEISPVEYRRRAQRAFDGVEIRAAKFPPFGHDGERVRPIEHLGAGLAQNEILALTVNPDALGHRDPIIGTHLRARRPERLHQDAAGRLPHVIGIGFEGKAPQCNGLAL